MAGKAFKSITLAFPFERDFFNGVLRPMTQSKWNCFPPGPNVEGEAGLLPLTEGLSMRCGTPRVGIRLLSTALS